MEQPVLAHSLQQQRLSKKELKKIKEGKKLDDLVYASGFELGSQQNILGKIGHSKEDEDSSSSDLDSSAKIEKSSLSNGKTGGIKKRKVTRGQTGQSSAQSASKEKSFSQKFNEAEEQKKRKRKADADRKNLTKSSKRSRVENYKDEKKNEELENQEQMYIKWKEATYQPLANLLSQLYYNQEKESATSLSEDILRTMDARILADYDQPQQQRLQNPDGLVDDREADAKNALKREEEKFFENDDIESLQNEMKLLDFERKSSNFPLLKAFFDDQMARESLYRQKLRESIHDSVEYDDNSNLISNKIRHSVYQLASNTDLETLTPEYCSNYLRGPLKTYIPWERGCKNGEKCVGHLAPQIPPDSKKNSAVTEGIELRELLLPSQEREARRTGNLPKERQLCLLCNRFKTTANVWINMQKGVNAKELLQDHQYNVDGNDGYNREMCIAPVNNSKKFNGIIGYFVRFSMTHYIPTRSLITLRINGEEKVEEVLTFAEVKNLRPNNSYIPSPQSDVRFGAFDSEALADQSSNHLF